MLLTFTNHIYYYFNLKILCDKICSIFSILSTKKKKTFSLVNSHLLKLW